MADPLALAGMGVWTLVCVILGYAMGKSADEDRDEDPGAATAEDLEQ